MINIIKFYLIIEYKINKNFILKMEKSKKYMEEIKSFRCSICNSNLVFKYLNQSQRITLCSNKEVNHNFNKYLIF